MSESDFSKVGKQLFLRTPILKNTSGRLFLSDPRKSGNETQKLESSLEAPL